MKKDFSYPLILLLFFIAGVLSWRMHFRVCRQQDTVNISSFPTRIGQWESEEIPLSEDELNILETKNVFVRKYSNPEGQAIYLYIIYAQNNRKVSHPPEICYAGGGAVILENEQDFIVADGVNIVVNRLMVENNLISQIVFYWFKVGNSFTPNYWKQQVLVLLKAFLGQSASNALIRISVVVRNEDKAAAVIQAKKFGELIIPYINKYLP